MRCSWKPERIDEFFRVDKSDPRIIPFLDDDHTFVIIALISTVSFYYCIIYCLICCCTSDSRFARKESTVFRAGIGLTGTIFDTTFRRSLFPISSGKNVVGKHGYKLFFDWLLKLSCMQKLGWGWQFVDIITGGCFIASILKTHAGIAYAASVFFIFSCIALVVLLILDVSSYAESPLRKDKRRVLRIRWGILVFVPLDDIPMIIFASYIFIADSGSYFSFLSLVISVQSILFYYPIKVVFEQKGITTTMIKSRHEGITSTNFTPESPDSWTIIQFSGTPIVEYKCANDQMYLQNESVSPNVQGLQPGSAYSIELSHSSIDVYTNANTPEQLETKIPQTSSTNSIEGELKISDFENISPGGVKRRAKKWSEWTRNQKNNT